MVREIRDCPSERKNDTHREITFEFEYENENDIALIEEINRLCAKQPRCQNCINFYYEGCFGGYKCCACKVYGNLEYVKNSHYDMDGSKCKDYIRK